MQRAADLLSVGVCLVLQPVEEGGGAVDADGVAGLAVDQRRVAVERRFQVLLIGDLEDRDIVAKRQQQVETAFRGVREQVRDQDHQTAPAAGGEHLAYRVVEAGVAACVEIGEKVKRAPYLSRAVQRPEHLVGVARVGRQGDPIEGGEGDVGQGGGDPARGVELAAAVGARPRRHGAAAVEQDVDREIAVLLEHPQQQAIEPEVRAPVEVAHVVALDVGAVVRELDSGAEVGGAVLSLEAAGGYAARQQPQALQAGEEGRLEGEGRNGRPRRAGRAFSALGHVVDQILEQIVQVDALRLALEVQQDPVA